MGKAISDVLSITQTCQSRSSTINAQTGYTKVLSFLFISDISFHKRTLQKIEKRGENGAADADDDHADDDDVRAAEQAADLDHITQTAVGAEHFRRDQAAPGGVQRDFQAGEDMRQRGRDRDLEQDAELGCAKGLADPDMYLFDGFDAGIRVDDAGNERGKKHNGCLCHNADAQKDDHDRDPGDRRNIPNKVKHGAERRVHGFPPGHHDAERHADTRAEAEAQQGDAQAGEDVGGERSPIRLFRSPFCNAGFDLLGTSSQPFVSLGRYIANPLINLVIMLLIIIGGIGFLTWDDICSHKWHIRRYRVQSKVILWTSALLIIIPAVFFFVVDFTGSSTGTRLLASTFQSVTTRTAGFNTADLTAMTPTSKSVMIMLMLIGGSPGSTAGGMKTTTFAVLILNMVATFRQKEDIEIFGRRLDSHAIKNAATIVALYIILFFIGGIAISSIEHLPLLDCLFETASAVGTVGLTLGITPTLGIPSQLILILLMFFGRVGGLTLIYAAISVKQNGVKLPLEKITVG